MYGQYRFIDSSAPAVGAPAGGSAFSGADPAIVFHVFCVYKVYPVAADPRVSASVTSLSPYINADIGKRLRAAINSVVNDGYMIAARNSHSVLPRVNQRVIGCHLV